MGRRTCSELAVRTWPARSDKTRYYDDSNSSPQKSKSLADTTLQVPNYVLMLHAQDLPGEHGVPVLHELNIAPIVAADVVEDCK